MQSMTPHRTSARCGIMDCTKACIFERVSLSTEEDERGYHTIHTTPSQHPPNRIQSMFLSEENHGKVCESLSASAISDGGGGPFLGAATEDSLAKL